MSEIDCATTMSFAEWAKCAAAPGLGPSPRPVGAVEQPVTPGVRPAADWIPAAVILLGWAAFLAVLLIRRARRK